MTEMKLTTSPMRDMLCKTEISKPIFGFLKLFDHFSQICEVYEENLVVCSFTRNIALNVHYVLRSRTIWSDCHFRKCRLRLK